MSVFTTNIEPSDSTIDNTISVAVNKLREPDWYPPPTPRTSLSHAHFSGE